MKFSRVKDSYTLYAEVYDAVKGDRSDGVALVGDFIRNYRPGARRLLDLACGTGSIAQGLVAEYEVWGLDQSPGMLKKARQKLPAMPLIQADMVNFSIDQKFDVVYCLHNSMNHLLTFQQWQQMFERVAAHLEPGGMFMFDFNPLDKVREMAGYGPGIYPAGQHYVISQIFAQTERPELFHWDMKLLLRRGRGKFVERHRVVPISAYPPEQVAEALGEYFTIALQFVQTQPTRSDDMGRVYFVCLKP